jgi:hypothetical protein
LGGESLADELGGWDEEDEEDEEFGSEDDDTRERISGEGERDSGIDVTSSPSDPVRQKPGGLLTVALRGSKGHRRKGSEYDGSEYGSESDFEEAQLVSASLEARLAAVESLARRGTGDIIGQESVIKRTTVQLQDLGPQSGIESGSSRYVGLQTSIAVYD